MLIKMPVINANYRRQEKHPEIVSSSSGLGWLPVVVEAGGGSRKNCGKGGRAKNPVKTAYRGDRAMHPVNAARQGFQRKWPGKSVGKGGTEMQKRKAAGQGIRARGRWFNLGERVVGKAKNGKGYSILTN